MRLPRQWLLLLGLFSALSGSGSAASGKWLMAYYRPWYVAKPHSPSWGWHWTMDRFNPEQLDASGQPPIASWYRPLIGPYDSADPAVLEYHILLMKLAGIDGIVVSWHGPDNYLDYAVNNERTRALFELARNAGLKFALCYEDQSVQRQVADGRLAVADAVAHARQTLVYAQDHFFGDAAYLRLNDRPVLLNFGPQFFKEDAQWEEILSALEPTNRPALFTEDFRLTTGAGAFNWPPMYLSLAGGTRGVLSQTALENYLAGFEERAKLWPAFISSAFPRFHDVYQSAGVGDSWGYLGDRKGSTFRHTLARALTNSSAIAMVVTWNDFAEGTMVEPTVEYGFRDLGIVQEQRRLHLDRAFTFRQTDLSLALDYYRLRRRAGLPPAPRARLEQVFDQIVAGRLQDARLALAQMDSFARPQGETEAEPGK
jgi:hypothetical protein